MFAGRSRLIELFEKRTSSALEQKEVAKEFRLLIKKDTAIQGAHESIQYSHREATGE